MAGSEPLRSEEAVALSNCDREPIHTIGRIQSFGALFAFCATANEITHYSDNLCELFPGLHIPEPNETLKTFIPEAECRHAIRGAMGLPTLREQREWLGRQTVGGVSAELGLYQTGELFVVELQPVKPSHADEEVSRQGVTQLRALLSGLDSGRGVESLLQSATSVLRKLTGFDRVMAYRFLPNGDGEVAAETHGPGIETFLGLRYPAYDIPLQARQVMLRATSRMIRDIDDPHTSVIAVGGFPQLDLSLSHLRGVSPIHIEYLRNMGVQATMNISLIVGGQLWGLFALHHYRTRNLSPSVLSIAEVFGQLASMQIQQEIEREAASKRTRLNEAMAAIPENTTGLDGVYREFGDAIIAAAGVDGMAAVNGDEVFRCGSTPTEEAIRAICQVATETSMTFESLASTECVAPESLGKTAGAVVQRSGPSTWMLFFRDEIRHELRWAGDPNKTITYGPNGPRLEPRSSFREYTEKASLKCREWTRSDESVTQFVGGALIGYVLAEAANRQQFSDRIKSQQDLLIAELNHRVRNTLALVQSLARQSSTDSKSIEQYVDSLEQRIASLATAHSLVGASGQQWARISDMVNSELEAYQGLCPSVVTDGPALAVKAEIAPIVALLIHELTSNAVKHGAMSGRGKRLEVTWEQSSVGATFRWQEELTTPVTPPHKQGFGLTLLERAIPHECGGRSSVRMEGSGIEAELWLPDDVVTLLMPREDQIHRTARPEPPRLPSEPLGDGLVLEDNMVLAMELEKTLKAIGATGVSTVGSIKEALEAFQRVPFKFALMDINLGEQTSFEVALEALRRGVAVVFVTGYDSDFELPTELREVPRLTKPVNRTDLLFAVNEAINAQSSADSVDPGEEHAN